jgi:hypothetical protein
MKLPDFTDDPGLNALRRAMGATEEGNFTTQYRPNALTLEELEILSRDGIEVSIDEISRLDDGTLGYKDSRVLVYIRDVPVYGNDFKLPKFHVAYCSTLENMKLKNRFGRYVVFTRENGKFPINKIENGKMRDRSEERLDVCQNCLNALNFDSFAFSIPRSRRQAIVRNFTIQRFFEIFPKSFHIHRPEHDHITAPINEYSSGFSEAARNYKTDVGWQCQKCGLDFADPADRKFLHVHHQNALKYDDNKENFRALCIGCHAEESQHAHMKSLTDYKEFLKRFGGRWSRASRH